jgi:hypothetical protein
MKAILEFNLDEIEDQYNHKQCLKGKDMALMLWDFKEFLRVELKHGNLTPPAYAQMERVQDRFFSELSERGIYLDDIIY